MGDRFLWFVFLLKIQTQEHGSSPHFTRPASGWGSDQLVPGVSQPAATADTEMSDLG